MKVAGVVVVLCSVMCMSVRAEPSLRFFGRLSMHGYSVDTRDQSSTFIADDKSQNSRIGFVFTQSLNDSLMGVGQVDWGFQPTDAEPLFQQRETYVGLRGAFGQVALGTFNGAYKATGGVVWDPFVTTPLESRRQVGMAGGAYAHSAFMRRMLEYRSPVVMGISGRIQYGLDRRDTTVAGSHGDVNAGVECRIRDDLVMIAALSYADSESSGENLNWKVGTRWHPGAWTFAVQYEDVEIRKAGHRIDYASISENEDGSRAWTGANFITAAQENDEAAGINSATTHIFAHASYRHNAHEVHGIYGNMQAKDVRGYTINAYTLGYSHWLSNSFCVMGGVQYQDRQKGWDSGDVVVASVGLRYDFGGDLR